MSYLVSKATSGVYQKNHRRNRRCFYISYLTNKVSLVSNYRAQYIIVQTFLFLDIHIFFL